MHFAKYFLNRLRTALIHREALPVPIAGRAHFFKLFNNAEPDETKEPFTIVIPPPNITGQLHMGHALDNTMQDCFCILPHTELCDGVGKGYLRYFCAVCMLF